MIQTSDLKGIFPAMFTPITERGEVDESGLRRLVQYLLSAGVHGLFVLGSCGEFPAFSSEERRGIVEKVVDEVKGNVPVIVGTSGESTGKTILNTKIAGQVGADAAVILPPYYFTSTQEEIVDHFRAVLAETDIPVMIYNNPFSARVKISLDTLETLSGEESVVAIKDSTGDFGFHEQLVNTLAGVNVRIFQGDERLAAASILIGTDGGTLGLASIAPRLFVDIYEAAKAGDYNRAFQLQYEANSLLEIFEVVGATDGSFFAAGKAALQLLGICGPWVSRPFRPLTEEQVLQVEQVLRQHNLL